MPVNLYATLVEYKDFVTARGQAPNADAVDDAVIRDLLETASRYLDDQTGRQFYPSIETRRYDYPEGRSIKLDQDLLEVIAFTNGDGTAISSSNYVLEPANRTPYRKIALKNTSMVYWLTNSNSDIEQVISMQAFWGYRTQYAQRGWKIAGTLGAAITDTTTLAFTMTAGHILKDGHLVKIGSELYNISSVSINTITPYARGDNGSTAATHLNGSTVYIWKPEEQAHQAVLEIANTTYQRRFGKSTSDTARVTAAGVVLTPRDIPSMAQSFIDRLKRRT